MHYVNSDIILDTDEARRFQYLLRHPDVENTQKKLKECMDSLAEMNYQENEDGTSSFDIDIDIEV